MHDLNDLYYFAMVVDHGGFAAAERALGIPKSRLSRRISQLETDLGVRLLQRSTRRFAVTDVGTSVHRHAQTMLAEAQALTDTLTGLRNRRALDLVLHQLCELRQPFGLIHLDLDFFKQVNDTLGHAAGDHVLQVAAQAHQY